MIYEIVMALLVLSAMASAAYLVGCGVGRREADLVAGPDLNIQRDEIAALQRDEIAALRTALDVERKRTSDWVGRAAELAAGYKRSVVLARQAADGWGEAQKKLEAAREANRLLASVVVAQVCECGVCRKGVTP